jgi:hypothetical protein
VWLAGTLSGQSMRPRQDSWAELSSPAAAEAEDQARAVPTLKIRFRRIQHYVALFMTPPMMTGIGVIIAIALVLLFYRLTSTEEEQARPAAPAVVETSPPKAAAPAPPPPKGEQPDVTRFENLPLAADSADSDKKRAPRGAPPPPGQRAPQKTEQRLKDYGL